jgi:copper(I)-binding protein
MPARRLGLSGRASRVQSLKNLTARARGAGGWPHVNRNRLALWLVAVVLAGSPLLAGSHGYRAGDIRIVHPWAILTAPSITDGVNGIGYLVLKNSGGKSDTLLWASTKIARKVELRAHGRVGDTSTVRPVEAIEIPAGGEVRLEPDGPHLMLIGLKQALEEGQHFPVVLQFERAGKITVDMFVQKNAKSSIY